MSARGHHIIIRIMVIVALPLLIPNKAGALTMNQFMQICQSQQGKCSDHQLLQAYVGGALDLIATLDESTDYLTKIYCKKPENLFDTKAIIQYMEKHQKKYSTQNAMSVFIRYLKEKGKC